MQINENTPRSEITIQGATFVAPEPYAEGHTLNANEASVLNQTLHENLRNNFAGRVKTALEAVDGKVDNLDLPALQAEFDAYAAQYEFGVRKGGTRVPANPIEREALKIARRMVNTALKKMGIDPKDYPEEKLNEAIEAAAKRADVQASAQKIVEATQGLAGLELSAG